MCGIVGILHAIVPINPSCNTASHINSHGNANCCSTPSSNSSSPKSNSSTLSYSFSSVQSQKNLTNFAQIGPAAEAYEALSILQHRGQDAAGIITCAERTRMYQCKGNGLVRDVFAHDRLLALKGHMAVGHVRYPTSGCSSNTAESQPFYVNSPYGIALAHNGNLTNALELRDYLDNSAHRHINTDSDSELLLNIFADGLHRSGKPGLEDEDIMNAVESLFAKCRGGFACVAMIAGVGLVLFRDPHGIRPVAFGARPSMVYNGIEQNGCANMFDWMVASETAALSALGYTTGLRDVMPGEAVIIGLNRPGLCAVSRKLIHGLPRRPCVFEYIYFAREDSVIDGISVYHSRLAMGRALAKRILDVSKEKRLLECIDVVIPVPDTARAAALECAIALSRQYREGFCKNRYVGRTFIMPAQSMRKHSVQRKLNAMTSEFANKSVLLVDDSIVRGTTSREIILMARRAGARRVYFASCAPPVRYINVYGIDIPTRSELVAHGRTEDQIAEQIGADGVIFLSVKELEASISQFNPEIDAFECSVFNSEYVTGDITEKYMIDLENQRRNNNENGGESIMMPYRNGSGGGGVDPNVMESGITSLGSSLNNNNNNGRGGVGWCFRNSETIGLHNSFYDLSRY